MRLAALLLILLVRGGSAQNAFMKDYMDSYNYYVKEDFNIRFKIYTMETPTAREEMAGEGVLMKTGHEYYTMYGTNETYILHNTLIILDHSQKQVNCVTNYTLANMTSLNKNMLDSTLLSLADSVVYKGEISDCHVYRIYGYTEDYDMMDLWLRKNGQGVFKIVYMNSALTHKDKDAAAAYARVTVQYYFGEVADNKKYLDMKHIFTDEKKQILAARLKAYKLHVADLKKQ